MFVLSSLSCVIWWKNKHQWKGYQSDKMTYLKCWFEKNPLLSLSLVWLNWCFSEQLRRKFSQSVSSSLALYLFFFFPQGFLFCFCGVFVVGSFACLLVCLLRFFSGVYCLSTVSLRRTAVITIWYRYFSTRDLLDSWILFWNFWDKCVILLFPIAIIDREGEETLWVFLL